MTPVNQTQFGLAHGNCEQAAVASILGLPLDAVPDFIEQSNFAASYVDFLRSKGFAVVVVPPNRKPDCYYMAVGASEATGHPHACVYREGELVHDPHPGRRGLSRVDEVHLFVPIEIAL